MEDTEILALLAQRDETAILELRRKYGGYCQTIAYHILSSFEDTEECLADTWLRVWNAIPPASPDSLKAFVGRITRNLAIDRFRQKQRQGDTVMDEVLEELHAGSLGQPEETAEADALRRSISAFLRRQPREKRQLFVLRYWYMESIAEISRRTGLRQDRIRTELYRMRKKLRTTLKEEGYDL